MHAPFDLVQMEDSMYLSSLDKIDNAILNLLLNDARMSYSDIGNKVGLSRVAVKNRVAAMERAGIIKGYHFNTFAFACHRLGCATFSSSKRHRN